MADFAPHVVVVGAGFAGLAAAYELARGGARVTLLEREPDVGGLAGAFRIGGHPVEKFYHHWFTSDRHVSALIAELRLEDRVVVRPTRTGMYLAQRHWSLSTPLDVLRFAPLGPRARLRLALLVLRARRVRDWRALDGLSAEQWLQALGGPEVYRVVWEPLLRGKFGAHASRVSAVWFWSKLVLRGGSRGRGGRETLMYFRGGFAALAEAIAAAVRSAGGAVRAGADVTGLVVRDRAATGVRLADGTAVAADAVVATPALPIVAGLLEPHAPPAYVSALRRVEYLGNVCLVLALDRSLSSTYWLNVNDPGFPFVGVIEHTNLDAPSAYGGQHVVYLSRYLPADDPMYGLDDDAWLEAALPHLARMFPAFDSAWIRAHRVWRAPHAQPLVVRGYSRLIPSVRTPLDRLYLCTMAQIYPEDRGTNYAIGDGRMVARQVLQDLAAGPSGGVPGGA